MERYLSASLSGC